MRSPPGRALALALAVAAALLAALPRPAGAADVGQPAPDFRLPSTKGADVSLSDLRGRKWVLLEFYANDFAPT